MDRLKLVLQYFQSNSESISNGICIVLALISVKLYTSFDFNCPCIPQYNKLYALGVMFVPPLIFFFLGILVNRHTGVMMEEWLRPIGKRSKNPAIVKWVVKCCCQTTSCSCVYDHYHHSFSSKKRLLLPVINCDVIPNPLQVHVLCHDAEGSTGAHGVDSGHSAGWEDLHLCFQHECRPQAFLG